ncbi:hypothetical protein L917_15328 [Phytophthora nicotianae]|uniref:CCHC-type domain-containing protein n=1 Tax=Phytophthora nicotianae TaxID=4792 RepID=W2KKX5_PHYNI|nr:hypothetical protein L917_15328 [Phytophthora nicotianae]
MPTYHGRPHESVDEFIFRAKLFMQGKCIDFANPHNGPRVVVMLAANFRDGAASWYHAKVMVEHVAYRSIEELHATLTTEFVPLDQQFRLRAELRKSQIHGMHAIDQVDHFCEGLKSETTKEVISGSLQQSRDAAMSVPEGPTPMDISVMDSRQIDKRTCRERNSCFYCKKGDHRIANCPSRNGQSAGHKQGNGLARQT